MKSNKSARVIAVAKKGTALCFAPLPKGYEQGKPLFLARSRYEPIVNLCHAQGKAAPEEFASYNLCQFVSDRGEPIRLYPLSVALSKKIVKRVNCNATLPGGKTIRTEIFPLADFSFGKKQPAYVATSLPQGRFERASTCSAKVANRQGEITANSVKRNASLCAGLSAVR